MTSVKLPPDKEEQRKKRLLGIFVLAFIILTLIGLTILVGGPLLEAVRRGYSFRMWLRQRGFLKYPIMVGIVALQVVIAFIPGEPIEFAAGYMFGAPMGSLLCIIGFTLGSLLVVVVVRKFGMKLLRLIFSDRDIDHLQLFRNPKTRDFTIFMLFLIPGTPKDVLTYLAGILPLHLGKFLLISGVARLPSLLTSTLAGTWAGQDRMTMTLVIYAATVALTVPVVLIYRKWEKRQRADAAQADTAAKIKDANDVQAG
ncbi:MAG TPA: VTT domain-containing protein [Candidatus Limnocylindria bacterium]|nr:VTT domain-containing protein [Candidatus Limnocylindria bacterium]